jgi:hypothetical protein
MDMTPMPVRDCTGMMPVLLPVGLVVIPNILGMLGPVISASRMPIQPLLRRAMAHHAGYSDLPTALAGHGDNVLYVIQPLTGLTTRSGPFTPVIPAFGQMTLEELLGWVTWLPRPVSLYLAFSSFISRMALCCPGLSLAPIALSSFLISVCYY